MTSIFDQFNSTLIRENIPQNETSRPTSSGYVSVRTKSEPPIFSKQKMNLNLPHNISHLCVANDWLIILMTNYTILRMNLKQPDQFTEVPIDKYMAVLRPTNIFVDPTGVHLLIPVQPKVTGLSPEVLYLPRNSFKPKTLTKLKDYEITAIGFNNENTSETNTGPILFGTSKGIILEAEIGIDGSDKLIQNNVRQLFDVGRGENRPITGIAFYTKQEKQLNCIILVLTLDRLYKFQDTVQAGDKQSMLQSVFNVYLQNPKQLNDYEAISGKLNYSLGFNYQGNCPKSFGCLSDDGLKYEEIDPKVDDAKSVSDNDLIPYPTCEDLQQQDSSQKQVKTNIPLSFVLTDFHAILLYVDHVTALSLLNHQVVYEEYFVEQHGKLKNVVKDIKVNVTYVFSNKFIFRYKINNEKRNAWRLYADQNRFDLALKYCNDNPAHMDMVLVKQAQSLFDIGEYLKSAEIYSKTQSGFEEVCLKFLEKNRNDALMLYVNNRLERCKPQEKTQITMLIVWMVELFLIEMSRCSDNMEKERNFQKYFDDFMKLERVEGCMSQNRKVIYDLMASHGDNYNLTAFTTTNKDFESVINQYINQNSFGEALNVLKCQDKSDLFYKYCPLLMEEIPVETTAVMIAQGKRLDPIKMIPSLLCFDTPQHVKEIVKYLEFCILSVRCSEQAIHNYLIQLYSEHFKDKLLTFLETQGKDITLISYDIHYALRICLKNGNKDASVFLQCLLEMWIPAVELALTFDTKLAQATASQPSDRNLKKKLWLIIAKMEIRGKNDVKEALDILKACDLLRIEDLLPYFSDFQKIDHFKEAICASLKDYNEEIQEKRKDMDESAKSAERVRNKLQTFRNRSVTISAQEQCVICGICLLLKPFFIFHCGHKFHSDCLERKLIPLLSPENLRRLNQLKQTLSTMCAQPIDSVSLSGSTNTMAVSSISVKDKIKNEIEDILASECLYCGELMINSIDQCFIDDWDKVDSEWK